jgi:hypothetical protein
VAPGRPAVAVLLAAALLAGCGEPYEPIAEADRDPARVAAVEALGTGILQAWARDEYPPVEHAIAEFRAGWTEDRQRAADEQFEAELGDFVAMQFDHAERQASSGIEAYDFRATFDGTSQEQVVRVVVDADGRLAGFWIRPAASGSTERPSPSVPLVLASVAQVGVLAAGPAALVWTARKRLGAPLRLAAVGAIAFVASQLVHLPLNFALGILGPPRAVGLMPLPVIGVVAGLTAGLCEESARYVAMRWVLRRDRGWAAAVQYGLGHGGIDHLVAAGSGHPRRRPRDRLRRGAVLLGHARVPAARRGLGARLRDDVPRCRQRARHALRRRGTRPVAPPRDRGPHRPERTAGLRAADGAARPVRPAHGRGAPVRRVPRRHGPAGGLKSSPVTASGGAVQD